MYGPLSQVSGPVEPVPWTRRTTPPPPPPPTVFLRIPFGQLIVWA